VKRISELIEQVRVLRRSFGESSTCMRDVYDILAGQISCPAGTPAEFAVEMDDIPAAYYSFRKNLFSTLFMSIYHLLEIEPQRRLLYGKFNHLFRIWVTRADNLLDEEYKAVVPLRMAGASHIMRDVISIMAADRALNIILEQAKAAGTVTDAEAALLARDSLRVLLPSAAQEAGEEAGVASQPSPEYLISTVHRYKTGMLFYIPLLGPERIETHIPAERMAVIRNGLMDFGIGCQLLDDVRDMGRDLREMRNNYALALLQRDFPAEYAELRSLKDSDRLYRRLPKVVAPTARLGLKKMVQGLSQLDGAGLGISKRGVNVISRGMFKVLDLEDLAYV